MSNELIETTLPATNDELQMRLRALRARVKETIADIQADTAAMDETNYKSKRLNAYDEMDKRFKACSDAVVQSALPDAAKALLVELGAGRISVKEAIKERQDKLRALKDANDPKPEEFEWIMELRCCQKVAEAWLKKFDKDGLAYRVRRVKDGESAKIGKLFDTEEAK